MTSADIGRTLAAEGWQHSPDTGRDTWYNVTNDGEVIRVRWRDPAFMVRLTAQAADEGTSLHWEATLCHGTDQMVIDAARAALATDDDPPVIRRLSQEWESCPLRAMEADPLASFSYGTEDGRYLELRVLSDEREQVRPTMYVELESTGTRLYTEPECPAGVVAAVALG